MLAGFAIADVAVTEEAIEITLENGVVVTEPLSRHVTLEKATKAQLSQWEKTPGGFGLNWPEIKPPTPDGIIDVLYCLQNSLYDAAENRWESVGRDLTQLSTDDQQLVALYLMELEINNGGFLAFFENGGTTIYDLALAALTRMGANDTIKLLEAMMGLITPAITIAQSDASRDVMEVILATLTEQDDNALEELEKRFWDYPENLPALVVATYSDEVIRNNHT